MRLGVTGHQKREGADWSWVDDAVRRELSLLSAPVETWSSLAIGAVQLVAQATLDAGGTINETDPDWTATQLVKSDRDGPRHLWQLSDSAIRRWRSTTGKPYRPRTLDGVRSELEALGPWTFVAPTDLIATEIVKPGDTLGHYAHKHYGDAELWPRIHAANEDVVADSDDIFPGQRIRVPRPPTASSSR